MRWITAPLKIVNDALLLLTTVRHGAELVNRFLCVSKLNLVSEILMRSSILLVVDIRVIAFVLYSCSSLAVKSSISDIHTLWKAENMLHDFIHKCVAAACFL